MSEPKPAVWRLELIALATQAVNSLAATALDVKAAELAGLALKNTHEAIAVYMRATAPDRWSGKVDHTALRFALDTQLAGALAVLARFKPHADTTDRLRDHLANHGQEATDPLDKD